MNIVLVTTTIHVPEVLRAYRRIDPMVPFIVVGDRKSPHEEISRLAQELGNCEYLAPAAQQQLYPELSHAIGWNRIQRRNIGILEAAARGPDVILSIDDDNAPQEPSYFSDIRDAFQTEHRGNVAVGEWFNVGGLARDTFRYRGFPWSAKPTSDFREGEARIGVVNGLIYGDPDINATERMEKNPWVQFYAPEARAGIAVGGGLCWSPINSQNTAYRTELAPLMLLPPGVGRYDDIWGSYVAQTVMAAKGWSVRFGRPFVKQERNEQNVLKNLADEMFGLEQTECLIDRLRAAPVDPGWSVLENLTSVLESLDGQSFWSSVFSKAWVREWERMGW